MAAAIKKREFWINGEWQLYEEERVEVDTYENLARRQGPASLPHLKRSFKRGQKIEERTITAMGETFRVRDTLTWAVSA